MRPNTLKYILIAIYSVLGLIAVVNMPESIQVLDYLLSGEYLIRAERYWMKIIFDLGKILIVISILYNYRKGLRIKTKQLYLVWIMAVVFLYFDLPIHKCYNGNLESYWEVGRHFH